MSEPLTLTIKDVCSRLGVSKSVVYRLFERGDLVRMDISAHTVRIPRESFEAYWEQCQTKTNGGSAATEAGTPESEAAEKAASAARSMARQASLARMLSKPSRRSKG